MEAVLKATSGTIRSPSMTLHRFYIPPEIWNPDDLQLNESESRHAAEVLRLRPGDAVAVFNGLGTEIHARIQTLGKRSASLVAGEVLNVPLPSVQVLLAQAIPKGKNMDLVLQKAAELGASGIFPLITDRTVVRPPPEEAEEKRDKWQRIVIEACKQCGQNHLPAVHSPQSFSHFLTNLPVTSLRLIAAITPEAAPLHAILPTTAETPRSALILIGPEGDFTPAELHEALKGGFLPVSLGPIILRTETAALAALTLTRYELERRLVQPA